MSTTLPVSQPLALVVFLENVGHIHGLRLPQWVMNAVDFVTEEYAKFLLHLYGAYRQYNTVVILEDERATGPILADTLVHLSQQHQVDLLLLVHGNPECLVGYQGRQMVGMETFGPLLAAYHQNPTLLNLRMVYGLNCYGYTLAKTWLALGAQAVNGAVGVNWLPEPSLSIFLYYWLKGWRYSQAVQRSNQWAIRAWRTILRPDPAGAEHPWLQSSRQVVVGQRDLTIHA